MKAVRKTLLLNGDSWLPKSEARKLRDWWQGPRCSAEILDLGRRRFAVVATFFEDE